MDSIDQSLPIQNIPVFQETLRLSSTVEETAKVDIRKSVRTTNESINLLTTTETVDTVRVKKDELIMGDVPVSRYEGDVYIVPVLKEETVVTVRLRLVEEVHITRIRASESEQISVPLRTEQVEVTRTAVNFGTHNPDTTD